MKPKFFIDQNIPFNCKIGIDGLERNIPARKHSHNAAWVRLYRSMLRSAGWNDVTILGNHDSYEGYDVMIFYPGISYNGNINFFFGVDDNVVRRFSRIQEFEGRTFVLNHDMPMIGTTVSGRLSNKSTSLNVGNLNLARLDEVCENTERIDHISKFSRLCFGDSHCFSAYLPGYLVSRNDGLTLYSTLRDGVKETIEEKTGLKTQELTHLIFYMGNIDIRHHLCRQENPRERIHHMAIELSHQLRSLGIPNIELVQALPIENISRKLPKSGYYKGTPYYGSWEERSSLVNTFNMTLDKIVIENDWSIFRWPSTFLNDSGELDFDFMERPKSVHLSPLAYRWDLFEDELNFLHDNNGDQYNG